MTTTLEHFQAATLSLTRAGSIKDRLTDAYRNHLAFVDENDLPTELCDEFRALTHTLTRERPLLRGEDALRATVRKMSNHEAAEVASAVVRIFAAISRASLNITRVAAKNGSSVVPFYLAEAPA